MERPSGRPVRPRRAKVLHFRAGALAPGFRLSHGAADHFGVLAVSVYRGRRPPVVRLHLSANRLHGIIPVDRTQDRRRALGAHAARPRAVHAAQVFPQGRQARRMDRARVVDRIHFCRVFRGDKDAGDRSVRVFAGRLGNVLDRFLRLHHLRQCRMDAGTGLRLHVPVRAFPGRDVRPRHPAHHLRSGAGRSARPALDKDRSQGAGAG